ncbi:MAG TPA: hypothetical protein VN776_15770 [Terracidiphilus sp.]|nr:hypothetical protein [Terracidiphilus sp.]
MKQLIALPLCCLWLAAQNSPRRHPAGTDAQGNQLTVIETDFPDRPPESPRCVPREQYVLERSQAGQAAASKPVVTLCQDDPHIKTTAEVGPNRITVHREEGEGNGFFQHRMFQLSPWRAVTMEVCSFLSDRSSTYEEWDFRAMKGQAWVAKTKDGEALCRRDPKLFSFLLVPLVEYDARRLQASHTGLGSCAMKLDASGQNGFVTWGKPDPQDPVEVKLLWIGERTLLAQVADPHRYTNPARSWVNADHFEIWMGDRNDDASYMLQFGIPVDEGPVEVGFSNRSATKPAKLPVVRRWKAGPEGSAATVLLIELPPWGAEFWRGITIIYSQSLEGRAQKRLISTSRVRRGEKSTLGEQGTGLRFSEAGDHVTCAPVRGALDVIGGTGTPVEVPPAGLR